MRDLEIECRFLTKSNVKCTWKGLLEDLNQHCKDEHKYNASFGKRKELAWKYDKIFTETVDLLWENDEVFWCHHRSKGGIMYWTALHIAPKNHESEYFYQITCNMAANRMKQMILHEHCLNYETDLELIFATRRCVAMPYEALKLYFEVGKSDILDQIQFTARVMKIVK